MCSVGLLHLAVEVIQHIGDNVCPALIAVADIQLSWHS